MKYDMVLDGGSLEHIFNFPIALRNCMRMVKTGGVFATITPCNNLSGHGFYQFSPELYFSLMRDRNGYKLLDIFCHEISHDRIWYRPRDPDAIKSRLGPTSYKPVMMLVVARRIASADLPEFDIQQSDYAALWAGREHDSENIRTIMTFKKLARHLLAMCLPCKFKLRIRDLLEKDRFPAEFFTAVGSDGKSLFETARDAAHVRAGSDGN
jgi:hypothetical protein